MRLRKGRVQMFWGSVREDRASFLTIGEEMEIGHFYYIDDQYFKDFPDSYLMQNKEKVSGQLW